MSKSSLAPGAGDGFNKVIYKSQQYKDWYHM